MKDSYVFYRSFYTAIKKVPDKELRCDLYEAVHELGLNEHNIELTDSVGQIIMDLISPQLQANNERYKNGKKGGAPKGNKNAEKTTKKKQEKQPKQPMVDLKNNSKQPNVNVNDNDNVNVNIKEENIKEEKKQPNDRLISVVNYLEKNGKSINSFEYSILKNFTEMFNEVEIIKAIQIAFEKGKYLSYAFGILKNWITEKNKNANRTVELPSWFNQDFNSDIDYETNKDFKKFIEDFRKEEKNE